MKPFCAVKLLKTKPPRALGENCQMEGWVCRKCGWDSLPAWEQFAGKTAQMESS